VLAGMFLFEQHFVNGYYRCCAHCGGLDGKHNNIPQSWAVSILGLVFTQSCPAKPLTTTPPRNITGTNRGSELGTNTRLNAGEYLLSPNRAFMAYMQNDGNFVLYNGEGAIWASNTHNRGHHFRFQADGNLVVYTGANQAVWSPNIHGKGATRLVLQNDGNLVAYDRNGRAIWDSGTWRMRNAGPIDIR
jgi:hypothetical protein